jgi:lysophospholipase L1-like esterase
VKILEKIKNKQNDINGNPSVTIALLGDSVTQGCFELYKTGSESFQTEFRVEDGYHTKLRALLQMLYPSVPVNMIHAGISGNTAQQGLERVDRDVCAYHPDLTVVCFGLNDCTRGADRLEGYIADLAEIFKKLKACNSEIIFMTPNMMNTYVSYRDPDPLFLSIGQSIMNTQVSGTLDAYMDAARAVAKEENIPLCDCYAKWKKLQESGVDTTFLLANNVNHPNRDMHWLFAWELFNKIFFEA